MVTTCNLLKVLDLGGEKEILHKDAYQPRRIIKPASVTLHQNESELSNVYSS